MNRIRTALLTLVSIVAWAFLLVFVIAPLAAVEKLRQMREER